MGENHRPAILDNNNKYVYLKDIEEDIQPRFRVEKYFRRQDTELQPLRVPMLHATCEPHLFGASSSHSLETSLVRLVNFWDLVPILAQLLDQLSGIQLAITSSRLDDLGLFLQCEVLPCEIWSHIFLEESQNLVVRNGSWVGKVVDTGIFVLGHEDGSREKIVENGI